MFKPPSTASSLLPTAGASSPTFRSNHPLSRLLKSRVAKTVFLAYVGFCALFTLKHIFMYQSKPVPVVYRHFDLQRTYDPGEALLMCLDVCIFHQNSWTIFSNQPMSCPLHCR